MINDLTTAASANHRHGATSASAGSKSPLLNLYECGRDVMERFEKVKNLGRGAQVTLWHSWRLVQGLEGRFRGHPCAIG